MKTIIILFLTMTTFACAEKITDNSNLNQSEIQALIALPPDQDVQALKDILKSAQTKKGTISLRGSHHTQGGHTFYPNGIVVDLSNWRQMQLLTPTILRVQAGATWKDVLEFLNPLGLSVSIMQSDYDFSIGGTVSTNVHGWQANTPPLVSSIEGFHLLLADGRVVYCSRQENRDLFRAVIGGYGLLGIILDVDLYIMPNHIYSLKEWVITPPDFVDLFTKEIAHNPKAYMFFGRFKIDSGDFLKHLIVRVYEDQLNQTSSRELDSYGVISRIARFIFAQSRASDFFKDIRWWLESSAFISKLFDELPRNQLLYTSVDTYVTQDPEQTDLLQEYFIPVEKFADFVSFLQSLKDDICDDLMNITVRHVCKDTETLLAYAQTDILAFVLFFRGPRTATFDEKLKAVAQKMIDKAIELKGTYYLPYRPYPRLDQFQKAYPQYQEFLAIKKRYDPEGLFMNQFYAGYLRD